MRKTLLIILIVLFTNIVYLFPEDANAIPYFSRKYNTPCTMCHVQYPSLNTTGMTFKQNGYRLKGEEGEHVWQDKFFPFSGTASFIYKSVDKKGTGWEWEDEGGSQALFLLKNMEFFSAGTLAPQISYYISIGSERESQKTTGIAFVLFNDLIPESLINLKAGKFYNEFFYLSDKRRLTFEPYLSPVTLTQYGVEINGETHPQGIRYAAGAVNDEITPDDQDNSDVSNNIRGYYASFTYSIAGQTIGIRGYTTKAGKDSAAEKDHTQLDANLNINISPVFFTIAFYNQSDKYDPDPDIDDGHIDQDNLLSELIIKAGSKLIFDIRFEQQDIENIRERDNKYVYNIGYFISPNIGLISEYVKQEGTESKKDENRLQLGIQMAF